MPAKICIFFVTENLGDGWPHEFIYIDEAGFNLSKTRQRGRNIIGHRAIVHVPGQHRGNISLCAAISLQGLGPFNTNIS